LIATAAKASDCAAAIAMLRAPLELRYDEKDLLAANWTAAMPPNKARSAVSFKSGGAVRVPTRRDPLPSAS
jgi:hypothetical protein